MEQSYKEKYEQALSKAKDMLNYKEVRREDMEYLFPELAESEDEKIKNRLIKLIKMSNEVGGFALHKWEADEMLTWLEKQGEQKPLGYVHHIDEDGNYTKEAILEPNPYTGTGFDYNGHHWGMCARDGGVEILMDGNITSRVFPDKNNIIEQKPTDSYCQDCTNRKGCVNCENGELRETEQKPIEENNGNIGGISANWSEEDERIIDNIIYELEVNQEHISGVGYKIDWLQSLKDRMQPKQEWNEEDEKRIKKVMHILSLDGRISNEELKSIHDWLKSLRPHNRWKPSDEQMEALYKASKNEYLKADQYDVLSELWNNLKKLKEG